MEIVKVVQITNYVFGIQLKRALRNMFKKLYVKQDMIGLGHKSKEWFFNDPIRNYKTLEELEKCFVSVINSNMESK